MIRETLARAEPLHSYSLKRQYSFAVPLKYPVANSFTFIRGLEPANDYIPAGRYTPVHMHVSL